MIADSASFPDSPDEIQFQGGWPRWVNYNAYFWHEFLVKGAHIPIAEGFAKSRSKFLHLWDKFGKLSAVPRRVFFISNTQNNLDKVQEWTGTIDPMFTPEPIELLIRSVNTRFPSGENEFVVVGYESRLQPGSTFNGARLELIQKDGSDWEGSDNEWDKVLRKTITAK
jgi:hypothetical protein